MNHFLYYEPCIQLTQQCGLWALNVSNTVALSVMYVYCFALCKCQRNRDTRATDTVPLCSSYEILCEYSENSVPTLGHSPRRTIDEREHDRRRVTRSRQPSAAEMARLGIIHVIRESEQGKNSGMNAQSQK